MIIRTTRRALGPLIIALILPLSLAACEAPPIGETKAQPERDGSGHGAVAGATEVAEAPLQLVTIDSIGTVGLNDLLSSESRRLGTIAAPQRLYSDGRYVFADSGEGIEVIDSGAWTWDHVDHFHYYRAEPAVIGSVPGSGTAHIVGGPLSTAGGTGIFFPDTGDAIMLDNAALSRGEITERFRLKLPAHPGAFVPLGDGALVSEPPGRGTDPATNNARIRVLDANGEPSDESIPCAAPRAAVHTRIGAVVGCADGAVLGIATDSAVSLTHIPLPVGAAAAPTSFAGRKGRPTVAGVGPDAGVWLLNTRAREWSWIPTPVSPLRAAAVDDAAEHVVMLDTDGRVRVLQAGGEIAVTEPLLQAADLERATAITLTVDAQRAYLNAPESGVIYEIDFADSARIAREFRPEVAPEFFAEVGL